jgi:hypothetical protein
MAQDDTTTEILADLADSVSLSLDVVAAKNGNQAALERLHESRTVEKEFPGTRERAMGHALELIDDFHELGIDAELKYGGVSLETDEVTLHRIDIIISGGDGGD